MTFYRRWIAACTMGELVGIGVATTTALVVNAVIGEPTSRTAMVVTLLAFAAVGSVEGAALGGFQWLILRERLPRLKAREWIGVTIAVAVIGWIAGMVPSLSHSQQPIPQPEPSLAFVLLAAAGAGAAAGLCFGAAQWFILRRYTDHASRWVWIHAPAWAVAMAAIFLGASLPGSGSSTAVIAILGISGGLGAGLALGAITGLVARNLRPIDRQRPGEDRSALTSRTP